MKRSTYIFLCLALNMIIWGGLFFLIGWSYIRSFGTTPWLYMGAVFLGFGLLAFMLQIRSGMKWNRVVRIVGSHEEISIDDTSRKARIAPFKVETILYDSISARILSGVVRDGVFISRSKLAQTDPEAARQLLPSRKSMLARTRARSSKFAGCLWTFVILGTISGLFFPPIAIVFYVLVIVGYFIDRIRRRGRTISLPTTTTPLETIIRGKVEVASGYDFAGEKLKLAIKISNKSQLSITQVNVMVNLPDGFKVDGSNSQTLGSIPGGGFQSAIFWLQPMRCVDDQYGGIVTYRDARNKLCTVEIPSKRLVNVCPMLSSVDNPEVVLARLKLGGLARNCSSFEFEGNPGASFTLANARLVGMDAISHTEKTYEDGTYLGYSCYVGKTKFGDNQFAAEIQVSGAGDGGILTLSVYSDDERILSGFFVDVMKNVREHIEVVKERQCPVATCPKCGANLDLSAFDTEGVYHCEYCGALSKMPPWLATT